MKLLLAAESDAADLSGDSLDGESDANMRTTNDHKLVADQSDAMTYVSALTNDDGYSYTELHEAAEGNKKSMIPMPVRKLKKRAQVWKMQPIPTKPYTQIPTNG